MTHTNHNFMSRKLVCLFIFVFINALFYFKYLSRVNPVIALAFVGGYIVVVSYLSYCFLNKKVFSNRILNICLLILYVCAHLFLYWSIPKESINVDRWSVITSFWDSAFQGIYPYFSKSNAGNYPGPMPFYFVLALPFYFLGELGLFSITGLLLLIYFLYKKRDQESFTYSFYLILSSSAIFWELYARSAILINSMLVFILVYHLKDIDKMDKKRFWLSAIAGGLLLSTRSVFALVFLVWGIYILKEKIIPIGKLFGWGTVFVGSFALTFLPFILIYPDEFFIMNPFIVQSSFLLPSGWIPVLFVIAIIAGLLCKRKTDIIYYSGLTLFLSILIYFCYTSFVYGLKAAYIDSIIDISYFIFAFPFILFINSEKV